jgi:hypothetical protein
MQEFINLKIKKIHLSHGISMDVKWPIEEFTYESNVKFCRLNLFFRWDVPLQMNLNPNVEFVASWIKWQFSTMENHVYFFVWKPTFLPVLTCPIYNIWKDTCFKRDVTFHTHVIYSWDYQMHFKLSFMDEIWSHKYNCE